MKTKTKLKLALIALCWLSLLLIAPISKAHDTAGLIFCALLGIFVGVGAARLVSVVLAEDAERCAPKLYSAQELQDFLRRYVDTDQNGVQEIAMRYGCAKMALLSRLLLVASFSAGAIIALIVTKNILPYGLGVVGVGLGSILRPTLRFIRAKREVRRSFDDVWKAWQATQEPTQEQAQQQRGEEPERGAAE